MSHYQNPEVRVPCQVDGCFETFSKKGVMFRHIKEKHGGSKDCTEAGCSYNAKRKDRRTKHKENVHGFKEVYDLPETPQENFNYSLNEPMIINSQYLHGQYMSSNAQYSGFSTKTLSQNEPSCSAPAFGSNLSSAPSGFAVPGTLDAALQIKQVVLAESFNFHQPMLLSPLAYTNAWANSYAVLEQDNSWYTAACTPSVNSGMQHSLDWNSDGNNFDVEENGNMHY